MSEFEKCPWCDSEISREKFQQIESKIRKEELEKSEKRENEIKKKLKEKHLQEIQATEKSIEAREKTRFAKQLADSRKTNETTIAKLTKKLEDSKDDTKKLRAEIEAQVAKKHEDEIKDVRRICNEESDKKHLKVLADKNRENEKLLATVKELERKVQNQTANQLGEGAEVDLYSDLKSEFNEDDINRTELFQNGANIIQVVMHKGQACGKIVFDSKNRKSWRTEYAKKLIEDKESEGADHAILTTSRGFPGGKKELCIEGSVIVINPARAITIVSIIRKHMIRLAHLGLSIDERESKMAALYKYIASESFKQGLEQLSTIANGLLDLDVEESRRHKKTWDDRGRMLKRLERTVQSIDNEISFLMQGAEPEIVDIDEDLAEATNGLFD